MDDWIASAVEQAKALFDEGAWTMASVTPKGQDVNKADLYVFEGSPPKGYILASHFYNKVIALDQHFTVLKAFSMTDEVMGLYTESYSAAQGGMPQQDPFEGL